jgi:hypothetical protein
MVAFFKENNEKIKDCFSKSLKSWSLVELVMSKNAPSN